MSAKERVRAGLLAEQAILIARLQEITVELQNIDRLPKRTRTASQHVRAREKQISIAAKAFEVKYARKPVINDLEHITGYSYDDIRRSPAYKSGLIVKIIGKGKQKSLEGNISDQSGRYSELDKLIQEQKQDDTGFEID